MSSIFDRQSMAEVMQQADRDILAYVKMCEENGETPSFERAIDSFLFAQIVLHGTPQEEISNFTAGIAFGYVLRKHITEP